MEFNIQEFLSKNKLTGQSQMREDDNTGMVLRTNDEEGEHAVSNNSAAATTNFFI